MTLPLRWPPDAARPLAPLRSTGRNASASHPSSTNAARPAALPAEAATPPLRTPKAAALSKNAAHILALMGDSPNLHEIVTWPETPENTIAYAIIACGGSIIPYLLHRGRWRAVDDYFLAGLTASLSLMGSFLFSLFLPQLDLAPAAFYTGLFVSMTKSNLCPPTRLAIAGAFSGILMLNMAPIFTGIGGTLGLTAMLSVLCVNVLTHSSSCVFCLLWRAPLFNSDKQLELPLEPKPRSREAKIRNNGIYRRIANNRSPSVITSDGALININKEIPESQLQNVDCLRGRGAGFGWEGPLFLTVL